MRYAARMMSNGRQPKSGDRVKVTVYLDPDQHAAVRVRADRVGRSVSRYMADAALGVEPPQVAERMVVQELMAIRRVLLDARSDSDAVLVVLARLDEVLR